MTHSVSYCVEVKRMSKGQYPWSALVESFEQPPEDDDTIQDPLEQKQLLQASTKELAQTQENLKKFTKVSESSFDQLRQDLSVSQKECKELEQKFDSFQQEYEAAQQELLVLRNEIGGHEAPPLAEIRNIILHEYVIGHNKRVEGPALRQRVLRGVYHTLRQRAKVVKYLKSKGLCSQFTTDCEGILLLTKVQLEDMITSIIA